MKLKDIATIKHGFAFKGDYFTNVPTRNILLTPTNFTLKGGFQYADRYYSNDGEIPEEFVLHKDDLIVTMTDLSKEIDTIGYGALIPDDSDHVFLHNQRIGLVTLTNPTVDKFYLYWLMRTKSYQRTIAGSSNGATVHHTSPGRILNYSWDFPPLTTQKKIASILSAYDSQIENNQKRIKLLEQMAENLYKEWFVRFRFPGYETAEFEGGVPKGWKVVKVKECVDRLRFGTLYGKDSVESDGDVIVIDQSQEPYIGFHNNAPSHIADTQKPIILFGDHSCKFELMIIPFSLAENVVPFVAKSGIDTTFLYFTTHNLIQTTEYKRHWTEFVNKKILLPPANLQREYAKKVIDILSMKQQLIVENRLLSKQRDLLLPRLMSGKLSI